MAEKVLFESQSLDFSYNEMFGVFVSVVFPPPFSLALGEKYQVVWDGTEYEVTAIDTSAVMPNTVGAGNGAAWGYAGNNEPFVILYTEGSDISFISLTDTAPNTHTVSVYQTVEDAVLYTVSSTSLKKVADAIREKSGSAGPIAFPDGFVQKISSISGGGGGSSADVRYVTFMNGNTVLYKKPVAVGDDCVDVLTKGLISTPTKESTAQYNYTYYGWGATDNGAADANILKNITEDKTVYAIYTSTVRSYTITYYDSDGTTVLKTEQIAYGATPSYVPTKSGVSFSGWTPTPAAVTGNTAYTANWVEKLLFATASWEDIARVSEAGEAQQHFALGDTRVVSVNGVDCTFHIVGFDHDDLASGTGKAGITCMMNQCTTGDNVVWSTTSSSQSALYKDSTVYTKVNSYLTTLESELQGVIKSVKKKVDGKIGYGVTPSTGTITTLSCKLWIPAAQEIGLGYNYSSYSSQVANLGDKYAVFTSALVARNYFPPAATNWWLRNLNLNNGYTGFTYVFDNKINAYVHSKTAEKQIVLGFCI